MKKQIYSIIALALLAIVFTSCDKENTPVDPGGNDGGGNNGEHAELWHYNGQIKGLADIIPAFDENGNLFFTGTNQDEAEGSFHFVSVDKNGNERWDKIIEADAGSYAIYADGKIFIATQSPVTIRAFDSNTGNELWSSNYFDGKEYIYMPAIAYSNNKLYATSGGYFTEHLFTLNTENGNELWSRQIFADNFFNISVDGNRIYFGGLGEYQRFDDNGISCDSIWSWESDGKNISHSFAYNDINIAEDGNIYIRDNTKVYIISSQTGQATTTVDLGTDFNNSPSGLSIDADGNFYVGNGDWYKYSKSGELIWKTEIESGVINPNYIESPVITENGNLYNGESFSLTCVKPDGTLDWMLGTEQGVGNLHPVVIDYDGNIISYSTETGELRCYKGDGSKLATEGWPKRYGNMGNTCSR